MIRSDERLLVLLGIGFGLLWTLVSVLVSIQINAMIRPDSVGGIVTIALLLPAVVTAWVGETAYRSGVPMGEAAVVSGWLVASALVTAALITFGRKA